MSKKNYDKVEIVLPNTNIKVKFTPSVWNIKADKEGFVTIENIKKHFGSRITDIKPTSIKEVRVNDTTKFIIEGKGQVDDINDKDMFLIYEWFEDKFTAMEGTYRDKVTPINDYYYINSTTEDKSICDLCGGSFSEFDEVYFGDEITNTIGKKNVVIVVKPFKPIGTDEIEDTIIYGLELGSFRCVTPIWSRLQQRTIPLYTKEYIEAYKRIHRLYGAKQDDITIFSEVLGTMNNLIDYYLPSIMSNKDIKKKSPVAGEDYDESCMVDDTIVDEKGKVNTGFVKKLRINQINNKKTEE